MSVLIVFVTERRNPMDYHVWSAMLEAYRKLKTKQKQSPNSRKRFRLSGTTCCKVCN